VAFVVISPRAMTMTMTVFVAVSQATLERVLGEACIELSRKKQVRREQKRVA